MGNLRGDGKAIDVVCPAGVLNHGDLYCIGDWSGFLINDCLAAATDRKRALEVAFNRIWEIKLPSGLTPAVGDMLNWAAGAGFGRGDTDLVAAGTASSIGPVVKVVSVKNANGYAAVMLVGQPERV